MHTNKVCAEISTRRHYGRLLAALAFMSLSQAANAQVVPPSIAFPVCKIQPADFANWFVTGTVAANGAVKPANSVTFADTSNPPDCSFFQWAEQMFLWVTSPAYGSARVFQSPVFYNVSIEQNGVRTFIPNPPGRLTPFPIDASLRSAQVGPKGEQVTFNDGKLVPVITPRVGPTGRTVILDKSGRLIEIQRTRVEPGGKVVFLNNSGRAIDVQLGPDRKPFVLDKSGKPIPIAHVVVGRNGRAAFTTSSGSVIDIDQGQAGGGVLMAQNNTLVYYAIMTNEVYAYFLTGQKTQGICPTQFPTTQPELTDIVNFVSSQGKTFADPNALDALTIELKSAWVETTGLNASDYITMNAIIPTYTPSGNSWMLTGSRSAQLALVSLHVVGSVAGHPENIWATFEHINNTPNAAYEFFDSTFTKQSVNPSPVGNWLFSTSGSPSVFNQSHMDVVTNSPNITAHPGSSTCTSCTGSVSASDTLRVNAWGNSPPDGNLRAGKNTEVISINNSIRGMLLGGDVRGNYLFTGATWITNGTPQGTIQLANSALETYQQGTNCFDCHTTTNMLGGVQAQQGIGLSHIYGLLKPLFGSIPQIPPC